MEEKIFSLQNAEKKYKKQNNFGFAVLAVLCLFYLMQPSNERMIFAALVLVCVLGNITFQNYTRIRMFQDSQKEFLEQFENTRKKYFPNEVPLMACGYLEDNDGFYNVTLMSEKGMTIVFKNLIKTNYVFSKNGQFWYILSKQEECFCKVREPFCFEVLELDHQSFLRKKGMEWNQLSVIEGYVYQRFLKQIQKKQLIGKIAMDSGIDSLRKEKIYMAVFENGIKLYLTKEALQDMNIA